mmetsp:Transcript_21469/g.61302  ORF Transcript_21469/g.61302 Transcript_21469/m.61302 type:complete len:202 (+) Transcript_21469:2607-3212(+)
MRRTLRRVGMPPQSLRQACTHCKRTRSPQRPRPSRSPGRMLFIPRRRPHPLSASRRHPKPCRLAPPWSPSPVSRFLHGGPKILRSLATAARTTRMKWQTASFSRALTRRSCRAPRTPRRQKSTRQVPPSSDVASWISALRWTCHKSRSCFGSGRKNPTRPALCMTSRQMSSSERTRPAMNFGKSRGFSLTPPVCSRASFEA